MNHDRMREDLRAAARAVLCACLAESERRGMPYGTVHPDYRERRRCAYRALLSL